MTSLAVIGASGDVGYAVVVEALRRRWDVTAVGRDRDRMARLETELASPGLAVVVGSVSTEADAARLVADVPVGDLDGVVTAVNGPRVRRPMREWTEEDLAGLLRADLIPHFVAAKVFAGALTPGSVYLGVGGGMADFVLSGNGHNSMTQAAQRMMFRSLAHELPADGVLVRELVVASMINGRSSHSHARSDWLTATEVAAKACDVVADPAEHNGPIITMRRRDRMSVSAD